MIKILRSKTKIFYNLIRVYTVLRIRKNIAYNDVENKKNLVKI